MNLIFLTILLPLAAGLLTLAVPGRWRGVREALLLLATLAGLVSALLFYKTTLTVNLPWVGFGLELSFRLYQFSAFIVLAVAVFSFLVALYSCWSMAGRPSAGQFFAYLLLTVAFTNGAVLADNLILFLFFGEALLLTIFGMIIIGRPGAWRTAVKAFIIVGAADLCLMFGVILTGKLAGTFAMSQINLPLGGPASLAFIFMMIGALAKSGSMPFHTWIPDAALDAPLPFMALLPAALEKLLGIYFLARLTLDLFQLRPESWLSTLLMVIGALTIVLAVMMALIQKDYKKLLSYHAISQVGYMILGIGTAVPVGIVGGLFHLLNNAMYKSCLFLSGGSVEEQAGTTDLTRLGGLFSKMPVTGACFVVAALSISGVPPFNGFFSKELVYAGALERGWTFYAAALAGSFLTAASFLKLGHAVYFGRASGQDNPVKEAAWPALLPMIVIAGGCVLFGVYNALPLHAIEPVLGARLAHSFAGGPENWWLVLATAVVIGLALANHFYGVKRSGKAAGASDHIHYAPGLAPVYDLAEKKYFDPYDLGLKLAGALAQFLYWCDRAIDWLYESLAVGLAAAFSGLLRWCHSGNLSNYAVWALAGAAAVIYYIIR
ncbi:MAG: NADH-quinone oxidoreductase subunit L [Candidatus Saganbacteria bacterium]|nr:NADH-quinone oxidoreductase subunit L [Candidatus Saganbacteria bacterium]